MVEKISVAKMKADGDVKCVAGKNQANIINSPIGGKTPVGVDVDRGIIKEKTPKVGPNSPIGGKTPVRDVVKGKR